MRVIKQSLWFIAAIGLAIIATIFWYLDGMLGRMRDESTEPFFEE